MPSPHIDLVFILHAINATREAVLGQRRGVRQRHLSLGKIRDIIEHPPLADQQRIVGLLDEAFAGIATAKTNALFESHLQSVFTQRGKGWVKDRLGITHEFTNGAPRRPNIQLEAEGVSLIRSLNVHDLGFRWEARLPGECIKPINKSDVKGGRATFC